jgi:hypothetical protein
MSPSHSNRDNPDPLGSKGASLPTPKVVVTALDDLLARFPGMRKENRDLLELSLPPAPKPSAAQAEDIEARVCILAVLVTALLQESEESDREREYLLRRIKEMGRSPDDPAANSENPRGNSTLSNQAISYSEMRLDTIDGVLKALDEILLLFPEALLLLPQVATGTEASAEFASVSEDLSAWLALPAAAKPGASFSEELTARLDAISVRITDQFFNSEANGREIRFLHRILEQSKKRRDKPSNGDGEPGR